MGLKIFNVVIWFIAGILNLTNDRISKFSYAAAWIVLMIYLVAHCFMG